MKICPRCGSMLSSDTKSCPFCAENSSQNILFEPVEDDSASVDLEASARKKRRKSKLAQKIVMFAVAAVLAVAVFLSNYFRHLSVLSVVLGCYGFLTLIYPELFQQLYCVLFIREGRHLKPNLFYDIVHLILALTAISFAVILPIIY